MAESGGGPQWRSSQQSESSHAPNHFKTDHFPIHPPDSQAAWLPQADVLNCKWSFCSYVPLRLASTHNRCPWSRHLKGLCHTLALYPDQCVTLLVTEAKGWNHWNLQLFQWFSTWADSANKGRHQKNKMNPKFLYQKKMRFFYFFCKQGGVSLGTYPIFVTGTTVGAFQTVGHDMDYIDDIYVLVLGPNIFGP